MAAKHRLAANFIHLGMGVTAEPQPAFDGMEWYQDYTQRTAADGKEGCLVSQHRFTEGWPSWERHPHGSEVVSCTRGAMVLTQEFPDGRIETMTLEAGDYAINPPGVWHIADVETHAEAIFITAGEGTQHRERGASAAASLPPAERRRLADTIRDKSARARHKAATLDR